MPTEMEIEECLARGGGECPWCASLQIDIKHVEQIDANVYKKYTCDVCTTKWTEKFTLTAIKIGDWWYKNNGSKEKEVDND